MKKLILALALCAISFGVDAQATAPRFGTTKNTDNTGRVITYGYSAPTFTSVMTVAPNKSITYVKPGTLTAAIAVITTTTNSKVCDELTFVFTADGTARAVTFSTNIVSNGTITVAASKQASAKFMFDGVNYVETARFTQP